MLDTRKRREQRVKARIAAAGLRVEPVGTAGALRIHGPGVDVTVSDLHHVSAVDLRPALEPELQALNPAA